MQEINYMLDLRSFAWTARKIVMSVSVNANGRKHLKKKLTKLSLCVSLSFRSALSEFEATFTFTDTAMKSEIVYG